MRNEFVKANSEANGNFNNYTFEVTCSNQGFVPKDLLNTIVILKVFLDADKKIELGNIKVENLFHIENLREYYIESKNKLDLPIQFEASLISIAISHTRSMFISKCSGTFLQNALLPIVNPMDFLKKSTQEKITKS